MFQDKHPSIYLKSNRSCCDYYPSNTFRNTWDLFKIGENHSIGYFRFLAGPYFIFQSFDALRPIVSDYFCPTMQYIILRNNWYHIIYLHYPFSQLSKYRVITIQPKKPGMFGRKSTGTVIFPRLHSKLYVTSRGSPLFSIRNGTERRKYPYHLPNFSVAYQPKTISGYRIINGKRHLADFGKTLAIVQRSST